MLIKEFRQSIHQTQKEFAETYNIPISTLRKWEQCQSTPPAYFCSLLIKSYNDRQKFCQKITAKNGETFYYNTYEKTLSDNKGNTIKIQADISKVKEQNLQLYVQELFDSLYLLREEFDNDCEWDSKENIIWS